MKNGKIAVSFHIPACAQTSELASSVGDFDSVEIPVKRYDDTENFLILALPVHITDLLTPEIPVPVEEFTSKVVAHQRLDRQALRHRIGG